MAVGNLTGKSAQHGAGDNRSLALAKIRQRQQALKQQLGVAPSEKERRMAIIEQNRQKALERQKMLKEMHAKPGASGNPGVNRDATLKPTQYIKPTIRTKDYIEYDFSSMKNLEDGFLVKDTDRDAPSGFKGKTLDEWKQAQLDRKSMEKDLPPPIDLHNAPRCFDCKVAVELDRRMLDVFHTRVCKACIEKHPEKYSLLTKTECKEDYFLTEPELADLKLFPRIVKQNPHSGTFSRMQLFLRYQIEQYAFEKWGSAEALDKEWLRREEMKKNRKEKRWTNKIKDMRKRLRAEEITRNLRKSDLTKKHIHEWCEPVHIEGNNYKKRCTMCGMEIEEMIVGSPAPSTPAPEATENQLLTNDD